MRFTRITTRTLLIAAFAGAVVLAVGTPATDDSNRGAVAASDTPSGYAASLNARAAARNAPGAAGFASSGDFRTARAGTAGPDADPLEALLQQASGEVRVVTDLATLTTGLVRVDRGGDLYPQAPAVGAPAAKVSAFLAEHGAVFGIEDAARQLRLVESREDQYGYTRVSYGQMHEGVPVFGAILYGHVDAGGKLTTVNGKFIPEVDLPTQPQVTQADALQRAVTTVTGQLPGRSKQAQLTVTSTKLMVFRKNLTRATGGENHLVYEVQVTDGQSLREFVYIDALDGKLVDQITGTHGAKSRRVHEASINSPAAWTEGDPRPALDPAHEDEITGAGYAYNLFFNLSDGTYRSWDGADAEMITVNNDPTIICPNANWNGTSTNYCTGTSSDDVVVHEWTHAYTQETSGLIYQWQSGALNESYSDIFGELSDLINNREQIGVGQIHMTAGNDGPRSQVDTVCSEFGNQTPTGDDSIRWLMGEDAFAFAPLPPIGDASIRDLWHPRCFGDPGHVNSTNYSCSSGDGGGVHTNSGVNNRAFALLVDGDTVELKDNGTPFAVPVTVTGIGFVKAAHIFWRANSVYNGPASNFADNADSLEMACEDLRVMGTDLTKLVTTAENGTYPHVGPGVGVYNDDTVDPMPELSGQVITAADCQQVANAIAAVEMRHDVTKQCSFGPMLDPAPAPRCGNAEVNPYFSEDWENGFPAGWSTGQAPQTKQVLDTQEWFLRNGDLPANPDGSAHPGSAIFQENRRDLGNCTTDDESGVLFLDSPPIDVNPNDAGFLLFEHYVNTELGYDGGNVMISINGGAFELIPSSAFVHNPYPGNLNDVLDQNTNPKGGQPAFHGGNENEVFGDWGESQIDLAALGVQPGDQIRLRWDFGQDGCNGNEGWFVDTVELFTCGDVVDPPTEQCNTYPASGFQPVFGSPISALLPPSVTTASVNGETPAVSNANIRNMRGSHTFIGDLTFELQSPVGTTVTLFDGSNCGDDDWDSTVEFDDTATNVIGCGDWLSGGTFQPHQTLSTFNGENANGDWTLTITDGFLLDEGQIDSWELELCTEITDDEEAGDKTTGGGWLADVGGGKINFGFNAKRQDDGFSGKLQLNDKSGDVKIHLKNVTSLGAVQGSCGAIVDGPDALEFRGTGSFNENQTASFRVCVEDNGEPGNSGSGGTPDRFYLACVDGCTYSTQTRTTDDALDGGNIQVHRAAQPAPGNPQAGAATLILDPVLMSEATIGTVQLFQVGVYGANQAPLSGESVSLTLLSEDGQAQTLNALAGPTGTALFNVTIGTERMEYRARAGGVESNAVDVTPVVLAQ